MRESACHCEGWGRLQKAEAQKGFILDVAAGIALKKTYRHICKCILWDNRAVYRGKNF